MNNMGKTDRILRGIGAIITLYLALTGSLWWLVLAIPLALTAIKGNCLPYRWLGINTNK